MTLPAAETDRLRALLEQITPGEWLTDKNDFAVTHAGNYSDGNEPFWISWMASLLVDESAETLAQIQANQRFIAAARNALPALLEERDALRAERDDWQRRAVSALESHELIAAKVLRLDAEKAALEQDVKLAADFAADQNRRAAEYLTQLQAAESRLRAREAELAWQPMDSAPRDGTIVDVWLGDADEAGRRFYCVGDSRRSAGWSWQGGKFRPSTGLTVGLNVTVTPTHWRPLPAGPPA